MLSSDFLRDLEIPPLEPTHVAMDVYSAGSLCGVSIVKNISILIK